MKSYIEQLENKHTMLIQKSILENDDHCKEHELGKLIFESIFAGFAISIIWWLAN